MSNSQDVNTSQLSISRVNAGTKGLRDYLTTQNECDYVKKRIKILAQIQEHNQAKVRYHQLSLDKIQNRKQDKQIQTNQKQDLSLKKKQNEEIRRMNNTIYRKQMKNRIKGVLKQIQEQKIQQRIRVREQSKHIALKIHQNRQKQLQQKKEKRNKVIQLQNSSKQNYQSYFRHKKEDLFKQSQNEQQKWRKKQQQKKLQINKMNSVELQYLAKQSQTIKQIDSVRSRLKQIYNLENDQKLQKIKK